MIIGLTIFHVLLTCLFPFSNSLWGMKQGEKKTQDSCFGTSLMFEALFLFFFPSGSVFVLDEAFLLQSHIFRVKGWLCALLLDPCFWKKKMHSRDGM